MSNYDNIFSKTPGRIKDASVAWDYNEIKGLFICNQLKFNRFFVSKNMDITHPIQKMIYLVQRKLLEPTWKKVICPHQVRQSFIVMELLYYPGGKILNTDKE